MGIAEDKRAELHDGDKTRQVEDFGIRIASIEDARKVKKLCTLINFSPEALFQGLFSRTQSGCLFDEVEMGENANDFWEAMGLEDVEELK